MQLHLIRILVILAGVLVAPVLQAHPEAGAGHGGGSWYFPMVPLLMTLLYALHRARVAEVTGWSVVFFLLGLPWTLLVIPLVEPGSRRIFGVELPEVHIEDRGIRVWWPETPDDEKEAGPDHQPKQPWKQVPPIVLGFLAVALLMPVSSTQLSSIDDHRMAMRWEVFWGFSDTPWLLYRRDGVREHFDGSWVDHWTGRGEWAFEPTLEAFITLLVVAVFLVLLSRYRKPSQGEP
ncbi:MAG: hypothetical protein Kow0020_14600 [Wenzhouxiangellaceae bacterium]